jgi:hypothetical protein
MAGTSAAVGNMSTAEQQAVLRMVSSGTITVEQAAELLDALERPPQAQAGPAPDLGTWLGELLSRNLGRRRGEGMVGPRPPRPPRPRRPPRPPGPHRTPRAAPGAGTGRQGLSFEDLVELKTEGVPKGYIDGMGDLFPDITMDQLLECHEGGVELDYARAMLAIFDEIDLPQLMELHESEVEPNFAAALRSEFPDLEPTIIIEAAEEGVDADDIDFFLNRRAPGRPVRGGDGEAHHGPEEAGDVGPIQA